MCTDSKTVLNTEQCSEIARAFQRINQARAENQRPVAPERRLHALGIVAQGTPADFPPPGAGGHPRFTEFSQTSLCEAARKIVLSPKKNSQNPIF